MNVDVYEYILIVNLKFEHHQILGKLINELKWIR